ELAKRILRLTGARSEIVFRPLPTDDPKVRQPDIGRARALLGWEPRVDVDEGLRLTIDWFRRRLRGGGSWSRAARESSALTWWTGRAPTAAQSTSWTTCGRAEARIVARR